VVDQNSFTLKEGTKAVAAEQLEEVPILLATVTSVISHLKNQLQQQYERAYPDLSDIIRYVIDEEEANAWALSSLSPHLFLPDLVEAHMAQLGLGRLFDRRENVPTPRDFPQIEEHPAQRSDNSYESLVSGAVPA
jgi:hypothetical protein